MKNPVQIKINIGFQDYLALALSFISFIAIPFIFPGNFYVYILSSTLLLSIFLEKRVQQLILVNSLIFLFMSRSVPFNQFDTMLLELIFLSSSSFMDFLGLGLLFVVFSVSIMCNFSIVMQPKNQHYLNYSNTFSSIIFVVIAIIYSVLIVQYTAIFDNSLISSFAVNFSFLGTIYLCFTLITNLFYVSFSVIFLVFLALSKLISLATPSQKQDKVKKVKKSINSKKKVKKPKDQKVRGV